MNPLNPRIKIHTAKQATLSGLHYDDLRSILTAASIHFYDSLRNAEAEKDSEGIAWYRHMIAVMDRNKLALDSAIASTFPPRPPPSKQERLARVISERKERLWLDSILKDILKNRRPKKKKSKTPLSP